MKYEVEINLSYERNRAKLKTKYAADNNEYKQENNDAGEEPHRDKRVSVYNQLCVAHNPSLDWFLSFSNAIDLDARE